MEKKRTRITINGAFPTATDSPNAIPYTIMSAPDPSGFLALTTAVNCATFAEALLKSAQSHHGNLDEAGLVVSFLEEAQQVLAAATKNVEACLAKMPKLAPGDQVVLDDKLWGEMRDRMPGTPQSQRG